MNVYNKSAFLPNAFFKTLSKVVEAEEVTLIHQC